MSERDIDKKSDAGQAGPEREGARPVRDWSRRRFGKAALGVPPIVATLYGRPLHAAANCTVSGWVSGNTSMHHDEQDCGGNTPGYWQGKGSKKEHPHWAANKDQKLSSGYGFPGLPVFMVGGSEPREATVHDAVQGPGQVPFNGVDGLTRQILRFGTAALLNARYLPDYELDVDEVTEIVGMTISFGYYESQAGDSLTATQVKAFLENTMNIPNWNTMG